MSEYPVAYSFPKDRWLDLRLFVFSRRLDGNLKKMMGNYFFGHFMLAGLLLAILQPYLSQPILLLGFVVGAVTALPMSLFFGSELALLSVNVYEFSQEYIVSFK